MVLFSAAVVVYIVSMVLMVFPVCFSSILLVPGDGASMVHCVWTGGCSVRAWSHMVRGRFSLL